MSKEYTVTVPLYGYIEVGVEADNEEDAKDKAYDDCLNIRADCSDMLGADHCTILPYECIHEGNTSHIEKSRMEVKED
ncbi:hypothetical protein CL622_03515 [archaeon]|nr:hypothetical protein [archaeon]|tara:strand:+ start:43 stop:276 length:234 start_codon:yes stop_codon:yes gene_type:complete